MNKLQHFMKKNSSNILTICSITGVAATSILAVKATPKALSLIYETQIIKGEKLTTAEVVKVAWKPYIPAAITGFSTMACILGINLLSTKNQAALASAYVFLDNSYREYRKKVNELYGEDAHNKIKNEMVESQYDDDIKVEDNEELFFDFISMQFFTSTMKNVVQAECAFLELLHTNKRAYLNEYYELLGIEPVSDGYTLGWYDVENNDPYGCEELEFNYEKVTMKNGNPCWIIDVNTMPTVDYVL